MNSLPKFQNQIISCRKCPRLLKWCSTVAVEKKPAYRNEEYWGKPVPSFGDPKAQVIIVGLAPGAHGANRTGRLFTGDRSAEWLFRALHQTGYANQPGSIHRNDGLQLTNAYVSAVVHCAPPDNKPTTQERDRCIPYLIEELSHLPNICVIVALGKFAWNGALLALSHLGHSISPKPKFTHGSEAKIGKFHLLGSYHPSQQNTFTGRLTEPMLRALFEKPEMILRPLSLSKNKWDALPSRI